MAYAFLAPSLILFLIFRHGPAVFSLILSLFNWTMVEDPRFVGLDNFTTLANDDIFWKSLANTVKYTLYAVPPDIVIALVLAVLLNQQLRGMRLFRLAYFVPVVTSGALVAIVWRWLYQPRGIINGVLGEIGVDPQRWLADPTLVLPSLAVMAIWKHVGFNMLILLAGLQAIPAELEEAAKLDGAGPIRIFFNITLPLLRPVIVLCTILTTIGAFQMFDAAYVMTGGGPFYSSTTLVYYIYVRAFEQYQMGYG
ncbi:MAG: sugar ABC transporter permease, partial [Thermomicrobiales bacterium]